MEKIASSLLLFSLLALDPAAAATSRAGFDVTLRSTTTSLSISILPHPGYTILVEAPLTVRLRTDGVAFASNIFRREDAVDPKAEAPRFELPFKKDRAAAHVEAALTFYLCKGARCRPVEETYGTSL